MRDHRGVRPPLPQDGLISNPRRVCYNLAGMCLPARMATDRKAGRSGKTIGSAGWRGGRKTRESAERRRFEVVRKGRCRYAQSHGCGKCVEDLHSVPEDAESMSLMAKRADASLQHQMICPSLRTPYRLGCVESYSMYPVTP